MEFGEQEGSFNTLCETINEAISSDDSQQNLRKLQEKLTHHRASLLKPLNLPVCETSHDFNRHVSY
jgi:hypothetical protein